jgi:hypothetical protein
MNRIAIPSLIVLMSLCCNVSYGQIKAVLVKLYSEVNRINHFESRGDKTNANYVREDAAEIVKATIGDFKNNFNTCKVYYFIDTNLNQVLAANLEGILLDEHLKPATNTVLKNGDTSFLIVYYGIPDDVETDDRDGTVYRSGGYPHDGLVVLGHDYKRVRRLDHFIYKNHPFRMKVRQFLYTSKRFAIEYRPWARELEENLEKYLDYVERKSSR